MTITLEAIRAAGGIVHSDGNIFFRDISMLQGLAGAAPAAVAPQGEYPQLPEAAVWSVAGEDGMPTLGKGWMFSPVQQGNATLPLFTARQMWAYHDLGRQSAPAAPALEAPAAPEPVGEAGTMPGTSGFTMVCFHADKVPLGTKLYTQPLAAAPQEPAAPTASLEAVQWRNIHKVVKALADFSFGGPNDPQWGIAHICMTQGLTAKDGLDILSLDLEPLASAQAAPAAPAVDALSQAARDVLAERRRQVEVEGYDQEHDDAHIAGEIGALAALYLMPDAARDWDASSSSYGETLGQALLPEDWDMPKMGEDRRRDVVKGIACGLAELERWDRASAQTNGGNAT